MDLFQPIRRPIITRLSQMIRRKEPMTGTNIFMLFLCQKGSIEIPLYDGGSSQVQQFAVTSATSACCSSSSLFLLAAVKSTGVIWRRVISHP